MRKFLPILFPIILFYSCALIKTGSIHDKELLILAGDTISAGEFIYLYEKNNFNNDSIYNDQDVDDYLQLFENFKLKVKAAKEEGIDTTKAFISEYTTYKDQLVRPYLAEAKESEKLVQEAYEHMKFEIDAAHIMVALKAEALPEDTIIAYTKIAGLLKQVQSGSDFDELAVQYSEDPSAKNNKGRLGFFTAFQMVYPFEKAAYNTPVDSISDILRSPYGYHILKVLEKRPYSGKVKVSHIMLLQGSGTEDLLRSKIFQIHDQAVGGADWNELCRKYSEDERTKDSGGTLPLLGLRQINDEAFEKTAFALQDPGQISDPVKSQFGWHIIRLEERIGLQSYDELKEELKQQVAKDDRAKLSYQAVIQQLKETSDFHQDATSRQRLLQFADTSIVQGKWNPVIPDSILTRTVYTIGGAPTQVSETVSAVKILQRRRTGISAHQYLSDLVDKSIENSLIAAEEKQLIASNPDVRMLLNEYYEGIMLFEVMNDNVWGKALEDTTGLRQYFESHRNEYLWGERADAFIVETPSEKVFNEIKNYPDSAEIMLIELRFSESTQLQALQNPAIDSLIETFRSYPGSTVSIITKENADVDQIKALLQYLKDNGVPEKSLLTSSGPGSENFLVVRLNSKAKKSFEFLYNGESTLTLRVSEGIFEKGKNAALDAVTWEAGRYESVFENDYRLVGIKQILPAAPKELEETKGALISDYQQYLEQEWLRQLRSKYAISLNERTVGQIKSYFNKKRHSAA